MASSMDLRLKQSLSKKCGRITRGEGQDSSRGYNCFNPQEQMYSSCSIDLFVFLKERKPGNAIEPVDLADEYLDVYGQSRAFLKASLGEKIRFSSFRITSNGFGCDQVFEPTSQVQEVWSHGEILTI